MPSRKIVKDYVADSFYHVFNQGSDGRKIFQDEQDFNQFLGLLKKYLSDENKQTNYANDIELQSYCLVPHSFHLILHVGENPRTLTEFMRKVGTSYSMYFNKKYKRRGQLLESRFKASRISDPSHVVKVSRYIHRQPEEYKSWPYSSVNYFIGDWHSDWVKPNRLYELYEWGAYERILDDLQDFENTLDEITPILANKHD